jgi:hypothetical protein
MGRTVEVLFLTNQPSRTLFIGKPNLGADYRHRKITCQEKNLIDSEKSNRFRK